MFGCNNVMQDVFMQDGARSHIANETFRFLNQQRYLTLLQPNMWLPNSPDLNPVDYRIWREPLNHLIGYYFCMVDPSKRRKGKNARSINTVTFRHLLHLYPAQKTCLCHNHLSRQTLPILKRSNHLLHVFNPELLMKDASIIPTKKTLMILSGNCH